MTPKTAWHFIDDFKGCQLMPKERATRINAEISRRRIIASAVWFALRC
jgi:hypothetical protein